MQELCRSCFLVLQLIGELDHILETYPAEEITEKESDRYKQVSIQERPETRVSHKNCKLPPRWSDPMQSAASWTRCWFQRVPAKGTRRQQRPLI